MSLRFVSWTAESSPFNDVFNCGSSTTTTSSSYGGAVGGIAWSPSLGLFVAVGSNCDFSTSIITSPGNGIWTSRGNPFLQARQGQSNAVIWVPELAKFFAIGANHLNTVNLIKSSDGINWTPNATFHPVPSFAMGWSADHNTLMLSASSRVNVSTDQFATFTTYFTPGAVTFSKLAYGNGVWVAVGSGAHTVYTSTDNGATWAPQTTAFDGGLATEVIWSESRSEFIVGGLGGSPQKGLLSSPDGFTWTAYSAPWLNYPSGIADIGDGLIAVSANEGHAPFGAVFLSDDLTTWDVPSTPMDDAIAAPTLAWSGELGKLMMFGAANPAGTTALVAGLAINPPIRAPRFFEGYLWRFIFADIPAADGDVGGRTTTWACGLQTNRQIAMTLDQATVISLDVWPDDIQVNQVDPDGYPLIAQSKRLVYCFRREGGTVPWKIRAAGIVMIVEDQGDADVPLTHLTCYDPWKLLEARPCVSPIDTLPDSMGFPSWTTFGLRGDQVIGGALKSTINSAAGGFAFIDAGPLYGGTTYYGGTIEATDQVILQIQQGMSVADVWNQVVQMGFCDIVLTPIYDPKNRPGYTHELNVYQLAGADQTTAVFSWDKLNRSSSNVDRLHDATPGNFTNVVQYFVGQGGPPAPLQKNLASINDFGYYWAQQFFPDQTIPSAEVVTALAAQALYLTRQGKRTLVLNPTPERSPIPLVDYGLGDFVPVYATSRLRAPITSGFATYPPAAFRVEGIPISISDDGIENVDGLLLSPDWRTSPFTPPVTDLLGSAVSGALDAANAAAGRARRATRRASYRLKKPLT